MNTTRRIVRATLIALTLNILTGATIVQERNGADYYRDFNIAKRAIQNCSCAEAIEYSRHEDVTLESFHFRVRTKSGLIVRLWFNEGMDVRKVCSEPDGLLVLHPSDWKTLSQGYGPASLVSSLAERRGKGMSVKDVLCNIDAWASMITANYSNAEIPRITHKDAEFNRYLHLEIVEKGKEDSFLYDRIR